MLVYGEVISFDNKTLNVELTIPRQGNINDFCDDNNKLDDSFIDISAAYWKEKDIEMHEDPEFAQYILRNERVIIAAILSDPNYNNESWKIS